MNKVRRQYTLPIVHRPDFTQYSYVVGGANKAVYSLIETWPNWSFKQCIVYGPKGYGKSHFGRILADYQSAKFLLASNISDKILSDMMVGGAYVIDEVESCVEPSMLFHFYNLAQERGCFVVYLMEDGPGKQNFRLPDLNSRFRSLNTIEIQQPDDALCKAIIRKIFIDYSLMVSEGVINYLFVHTSRSLDDIQDNIALLNQKALEGKRNITVPFVKEVLNC